LSTDYQKEMMNEKQWMNELNGTENNSLLKTYSKRRKTVGGTGAQLQNE
jgi:hypothetical protein